MKVLAFALSVVVTTALVLGGTVLIVLQSPRGAIGLQLLALFALTVMIYGPLMLGSLTSYWNVTKTQESRSFYQVWLWVVIGLESLGAIAIIVYAVIAHSPVWIPVVFIGAGVVLTVFGLLIGRFLLRHDEAHPQPLRWAPITRDEIRRKIGIIAITFVVTFIVWIGVLGILTATGVLGNDRNDTVENISVQLLFALGFAFFPASFACVLVSLPLNRRLRDAVDRDLGTIRKISKVVVGNKKIDLDPTEQVAAAKYAAIIPTTLAFMLSYIILLYLGLGIQQLQRIIFQQADALTIGLSVFLVVAIAIFIPVYAVRIRRARIYARDHASLLPDADAETTRTPNRV